MLAAIDSNFMIYAQGVVDDPKNQVAQKLLQQIDPQRIVLPLQAVAETTRWLIKRARLERSIASGFARDWCATYAQQATTAEVIEGALELVERHNFQVFDAIILSTAKQANADMLLTEDMQDGFAWKGVTVVNPFLATPHPLLVKLIS
jgi:predicted nucleic acid-binding protein